MRRFLRTPLITAFIFLCAAIAVAQDTTPAPSPSPQPEATPAQEVKPEAKAPDATAEAKPVESKPTIYFYRIRQFTGSALEPSVYCDDKELARMDNGRYFGVTLEPGKHECRMGDKQTGFEIDVKPDQTYFARITLDMGFWKGRGRLTLMQPEQGAFELKKVKLLGVDKVKNRTLVTVYEGSEKKP